jgi:uroporphyrinogen decarboxylase
VQDRDYPLQIGIGSLFGWLRNWMGFENVAVAAMDDPEWVEEMIEHLCTFIIETIRPAVEQVQFDCGAGWEDMCFNHGCIISPRLFRQWLTPRYKRITDLLRQHGVDIVYTDCDGNINDVVDGWLDGGVNCMFPVEVFAGSDPVELRRRFGRDILLMGGVNKRALAAGPEAIRAEIRRLEPLVAEGGFIPHVDHRVPPDVSYDDYLYYLRLKREAFGIPEPAPWEERKPRN